MIGKVAAQYPSAATMNFSDLTRGLGTQNDRRLVLHEFGHALGLVHEHELKSAGIKWDKPFIYKFCHDNYGWNQTLVNRNFFSMFEEDQTNHPMGKFDPLSIMTYEIYPGFTTDGLTTTPNYDLSEQDKQCIGTIYPK